MIAPSHGCPRLARAATILVALATGCGVIDQKTNPSTTVTVLSCCPNWWAWNVPSHHLVFLSLFHAHGDRIEGRLVRSWEASDDGRAWTYRLRSEARWHDGVPVTAHDVEFTLQLLSHPDLLHLPPGAATAEVVDDSTVTIAFERANEDDWTWTPLESDYPVLPRHLLADLPSGELFSWDFWRHPVGSGPYRFVREVEHTMVELEAHPDHFEPRPSIDRVIVKFQDGADARVQLMSGDVDVADIYTTEARSAFEFAREPSFDAYWRSTDWSYAVVWNTHHPILGDRRVRGALSLASDRKEVAAVLGYPNDVPLCDIPLTAQQRNRRDFPEPLPHDPAEAERLLDAAGWVDADGDGVREKEGAELRLTLLTGGWNAQQVAVLLQAQLARIGAALEVQPLTEPAIADRKESGQWDADLRAAHSAFPSELHALISDLAPGEARRELLSLLEAAEATIDADRLDDLYRRMWPIFRDELPLTYLAPNLLPAVAHSRLRGLANHERVSASRHLHELWIESGEPSREEGPTS